MASLDVVGAAVLVVGASEGVVDVAAGVDVLDALGDEALVVGVRLGVAGREVAEEDGLGLPDDGRVEIVAPPGVDGGDEGAAVEVAVVGLLGARGGRVKLGCGGAVGAIGVGLREGPRLRRRRTTGVE